MKQVTKMSRLTGMLEKAFNLLNQEWFNGALDTPVITVIPTPKAYAHYTTSDVWTTANGSKREINIASGTLDRPIEAIIASLMHEMVHFYNDTVLHVQDCSRGGTYHNKQFAAEAAKHGLIVTKLEKYGYARTAPADDLIEWILGHDELLREVELCRMNPTGAVGIGGKTASGGIGPAPAGNSHSIKWVCPQCRCTVRSTKAVRIICADCMTLMEQA